MPVPAQPPFRDSREPGEVEITRFEMQRVFAGDEEGLRLLLGNVNCRHCDTHDRHIVDFRVYANRLNDLVLRGHCGTCGGPVGRYLETGEDPVTAERVEAVVRERKG